MSAAIENAGRDMRKIIEFFMKKYPKETLDMVVALYRENGPQSIKFHGQTFTNRDLLMDDEVYDRYKKQLKYKEQPLNNSERKRVKQPLAFGTLDKFTSENIDKYIRRMKKLEADGFNNKVYIMPKYDGIGMRVYRYSDNKIVCLTRFDQQYGLDITSKVTPELLMYLPKFNEENSGCVECFRGELITLLDHAGFTSKRTYVSSHVSDLQVFPKDIVYIPYEFITIDSERNINVIDYSEQLKVFQFKHKVKLVTLNELKPQLFNNFRQTIPTEYLTDGVVIRPDQADFTYENRDKPLYQVAYKFDGEKAVGVQKIGKIVFSVGQQGFLRPVLYLQTPTMIDGINIEKATGNNMNYIIDNNLLPGNECIVSLKIVPRIVGKNIINLNEKERDKIIVQMKPKKCPNCGGPVQIDKSSPYIYQCKEYYQGCCYYNILKRAKTVLGIKGLGDVALQQMADDKDFNLYRWLRQQKPTDRELVMILSENMGQKNCDKLSDEQIKKLLKELLQKYSFI